ncbi:MAG: NHL repeat-containing protein [Gemmatimonadota bacterium]|nr:NHL repeat-containing protein [Gemmatimonadota bacterium]
MRGLLGRLATLGALALLWLVSPATAQDGGSRPIVGERSGLAPDAPLRTTLVYPPFAHTLGIHRARPAHLALFLGDRTTFDDPQGLAAVKFASDDDPSKKGDDFQLTLFGVNAGRHEILYNSSMQTLAIYGGEGTAEGRFRAPHGIAAAPDGRVYVADTGNERVARLRWDPVARGLEWVGSWPASAPFDVAVDARGQVYVSDRREEAVLRIADSAAGAGSGLLPDSPVSGDRWPLPDDVEAPLGIAVGDDRDPWYRPQGYRLYLVDRDGERLRAYDAGGRVLAEVSPEDVRGFDAGPGRFFYVALDYHGNLYVTDPIAGAVYKLDDRLRPLAVFPGPGEAGTALEAPRGIAIWRRFGQVFVAEERGAQYYFVGTDFVVDSPAEIRRDEAGSGYAIDLTLTEAATVKLTFLDAAGDTLGVADAGRVPQGSSSARWSAWIRFPVEDWMARAERVAIEARPTYSSRKRFSRTRTVPIEWASDPP